MTTIFTNVLRYFRDRHERRIAIRTLAGMDDHQLADIGIVRGSIVDVADGFLSHGMRHAG